MTSSRQDEPSALPPEAEGLLFIEWVRHLAKEELRLDQFGSAGAGESETFTFGDPAANHFVLGRTDTPGWNILNTNGLSESKVEKVVQSALERAQSQNFGGDLVYVTEMHADAYQLTPADSLHMIRMLGDQVRITGKRRLSDRVLLDFTEDSSGGLPPELPFPAATRIQVSMIVPGPSDGKLSQSVAAGLAETVAAVCALALGRVVRYDPVFYAAPEDEASEVLEQRHDTTIPGLARDHVSLDFIGELFSLGGADAFFRVRGALLSYHAALQQPNPDVATMLMVIAIEALVAPRQPWGKSNVTKRFITSMIELCPAEVDEAVAHLNIEEAFGYRKRGNQRRQRIDLLDRVYELRSVPSHMGIGPSGANPLIMLAEPGSMRLAILSDLVRAAILHFLQAPRSFILGHPSLERDP